MDYQLIDLMSKLSIERKHSSLTQPNIVPYLGIQGHWVHSRDFKFKGNTFGYYHCNYCQKSWMSAFSKKQYKQGCKICNRYFYAIYLWQNKFDPNYKKSKKALEDNKKPHMSELCEACKNGVCQEKNKYHY